jgi:hypothetical protein
MRLAQFVLGQERAVDVGLVTTICTPRSPELGISCRDVRCSLRCPPLIAMFAAHRDARRPLQHHAK